MAFETFDPRQRPLVDAALAFARNKYGRTGLCLETAISPTIRWRPTFHLKAGQIIIAFEYSDDLYPNAIDGAIVDITAFDRPVSIVQICPLSAFQGDRGQARTRLLISRGVGILTVDEDNLTVALQKSCVPIAQNIPEEEFTKSTATLPTSPKRSLRGAYDSYQVNVGQGLQEAGQVIEAMVVALATFGESKGFITGPVATTTPANLVDQLYNSGKPFASHRIVLGGLRNFIGSYRNVASHPQRTAAEKLEKIQGCRAGMLEAAKLAEGLRQVFKSVGCRIVLPGL